MKKISIALMVAVLLSLGTMYAQTIQDGIKDMYAERTKVPKPFLKN